MGKLLIPKAMILIHKPGDDAYYVSKSKGRNWLVEGTNINVSFDREIMDKSVINGENLEIFEVLKIESGSILFNLKTSNHHLGFLCLGPKGNKNSITHSEIEFIESLCIISSRPFQILECLKNYA